MFVRWCVCLFVLDVGAVGCLRLLVNSSVWVSVCRVLFVGWPLRLLLYLFVGLCVCWVGCLMVYLIVGVIVGLVVFGVWVCL